MTAGMSLVLLIIYSFCEWLDPLEFGRLCKCVGDCSGVFLFFLLLFCTTVNGVSSDSVSDGFGGENCVEWGGGV